MAVSILDVSKKCGLSTVTVSRVINGSGHVKELNRQKVLDAIQALGYTPNAAARSLVMGRTGLIGVVVSALTNSYSNRVILALKNHLLKRGYLISLFLYEDITMENAGKYILDEQRVDGYFVITPGVESMAVDKLSRYRQPVVVLDRQMDNVDCPFIDVDDYMGGVLAAEHLLSLGHTKIGYIDGPDMNCCHARKAGLCDTLQNAGLSLFAQAKGRLFDYSVGYSAVKRWHEEKRVPTAIFSCCDSVAMGAIEALLRRGYRIPEDVSVVGFDNIPLFQDYEIKLTTIEQPVEELSACAVDMMMCLLQEKPLDNTAVKLLPRLVPGSSTAPSPDAV